MNILRRAWCRFYQFCGRLLIPLLPYRKPEILDSVEKIPEILHRRQCRSVLIVTDRGVMDNHLGEHLFQVLHNAGIAFAVFDETVANPTVENVENAVRRYRESQAAGIIAIGGGSPMDLGKIVGARIVRPNKSVHKMHGLMKVMKTLPPLIAVPTTAGTGSETTLAAVVTDNANRYKHTIIDFSLIPHYAVLDYRLTVSLPPHLTAATGMDALTHAVEVYIGRSRTGETRRCALDAVKLIAENLKTAYENPADESARQNMLLAAHYAGIAFTVSYVGYVHCAAHTLGGFYHVPHGLANAVLLPIVLEMYGSAVHKPLAELARHAVLAENADSDSTAAAKFIAWIRAMNRSMGIPEKFDMILKKDIAEMAKRADAEGNPLYPVPVLWNARELEKIYHAARA